MLHPMRPLVLTVRDHMSSILNIYDSQYAYMYDKSTNTLPVRYVAVKYL